MTDDPLLWQRIALERGEPTDVPPQQRTRETAAVSSGNVTPDQPGTLYRIDLPWPRPPLNHNHRRNRWARTKLIAEVRAAVNKLAKWAKIPAADRIVVQLHYAPGHRRRQDPMNWTATSKPAIDGIVDAGVVIDDDSGHVHELTPEIHFPPEPGPRCWLTVKVERHDQ